MTETNIYFVKFTSALAAAASIELELPLPARMSMEHNQDSCVNTARTRLSIVSVVIEIRDGMNESVLGTLARTRRLSVYGIKGNKIVAVIEGDTFQAVEDVVNHVTGIEEVVRVSPIYIHNEGA